MRGLDQTVHPTKIVEKVAYGFMAQQFQGVDIFVGELLHNRFEKFELTAEQSAAPTDRPDVQNIKCYVDIDV